MIRRRVRLRSECADLYPHSMRGGAWHDARWAAETVRRQRHRGSADPGAPERILDEAHFEFEGGDFRPSGTAERRHRA
jgi:hypothetical protein